MKLRLFYVSTLLLIAILFTASHISNADDKKMDSACQMHSKDSKDKTTKKPVEKAQRFYIPPVQFHSVYSYQNKPKCCRIWDGMSLQYKLANNLKHIHGGLSDEANVPIFTETDPNPTGYFQDQESEDCKKKPCFPEGDPRVKEGKSQACDCKRECDNKSPISGCKTYCCEKNCGCGDCP